MRRVLLFALVLVGCAVLPSAAGAEGTCPHLEGMWFPPIENADGPEEFCWEVGLGEEQELRQIDPTHVGVYESGFQTLVLAAGEAHDAEGASVPTTLAKTGAKTVTLTVHHRAGNPLAGGAPFDYPVIDGPGWEGGFRTYEMVMMPPPELSPPPAPVEPAPSCVVPSLRHRSLKATRKILLTVNCRLGPVRGDRRPGARVVRQYRTPGTVLPAGAVVGVKLG